MLPAIFPGLLPCRSDEEQGHDAKPFVATDPKSRFRRRNRISIPRYPRAIDRPNQTIQDAGWHFRAEKPILEDFLAHIDHPYKAVREAIGRTIASIYRTRYFEAFKNVDTLLSQNKASSSNCKFCVIFGLVFEFGSCFVCFKIIESKAKVCLAIYARTTSLQPRDSAPSWSVISII